MKCHLPYMVIIITIYFWHKICNITYENFTLATFGVKLLDTISSQ